MEPRTPAPPTIDLALYVDRQYLRPMGAMLRSAVAQLSKGWRLRVFILHAENEFDESQVRSEVGELDATEIRLLPFDPAPYVRLFLRHMEYVTFASFNRLLVGSLLPPETERALLLDCDTIINGDLSDLWNSDMGGQIALAAINANESIVGLADRGMFTDLKIPASTPYFNAGVLLIDLARWRRAGIEAYALRLCREYQGRFAFGDQCLLNAALAGQWSPLSPVWNLQLGHFVCSFRKAFLIPRRELMAAKQHPKIIHYTGKTKPWHADCPHPLRDFYFAYAAESAPIENSGGSPFGRFLAAAAAASAKAELLLRRILMFRKRSIPVWRESCDLALYVAFQVVWLPWQWLLRSLTLATSKRQKSTAVLPTLRA